MYFQLMQSPEKYYFITWHWPVTLACKLDLWWTSFQRYILYMSRTDSEPNIWSYRKHQMNQKNNFSLMANQPSKVIRAIQFQ